MTAKKRGLGRGLDALLSGSAEVGDGPDDQLCNLGIQAIQPGQYQPRRHMDDERLEELAASIRAQGLIQPVVVRAIGRNRYELIAGERRWRAAQLAGLTELPALVRDVAPQAVLAMSLIENIQREELTPIEEARALQRLLDEFELTHQQASEAVGRSRAAVSNLLRLLDLPDPIRELLDAGRLDMGHARALLTLPAPTAIALAHAAAEAGWSVRELEAAARHKQAKASKNSSHGKNSPHDPDLDTLERELSEHLATRVSVQPGRSGRGKVVIHYHSLDELDGLLEHLRN